MREPEKQKPIRRGIYLLPNLFTVGALFAGFYAIIAATHHYYDIAAIAILISLLLDGLDGRIARLTHSESQFGAELDSMSDMVCFGIAPAFLLYSWSLFTLGKPGWLTAFFYTVCTALRLARFNSQSQSSNKRYFQGLSTTAAAGLVASVIWFCVKYDISGPTIAFPLLLMTLLLGLLKVSTVRYRSFKDIDLRGKVPFIVILMIVLILVFVSFAPPDVLLFIFAVYALSGPIMSMIMAQRKQRQKRLQMKKRQEKSHEDSESSK